MYISSSSNHQIHRSIDRTINLADTTGNSGAGSPPAGAVDSAGTKATLGESRPDLASVGTASEGAVGVEDGVTGLDEVGVARLAVWVLVSCLMVKLGVCGYLQGHSVDDELHGEVLSVGGDAVPDGRASGVVLAELVDQVPHDWDAVSRMLPEFLTELWILPS